MIISASYKTDIPAFYGQWMMNRLRAGFCCMINPYNRKQIRVSLRAEDVEGIVFWTKNLRPFLRHLPEVRRMGFPFVVQYTINGYPRELESAVIDADGAAIDFRRVAEEYGPDTCVWRYDTIVNTSLTPPDFHRANFDRLAKRLQGATNEVVISFAHFYRKTIRNMTIAGRQAGFNWIDPDDEEKRQLLADLVAIAGSHGMKLSVCSQRHLLIEGAGDARCIDADRLGRVAGRTLDVRLRGNRPDCGCHESRDIGDYDSCPHGCVYCYAVRDHAAARANHQRHDDKSEFLIAPTPSN